MSEQLDDILPEAPDGEFVHWMARRPVSLGAAGISATAAGAFALGVAATVAVLALMHWLGPRREVRPPWTWGRGRRH